MWHRGYVRSPADFPWVGETVPRLRFGRRGTHDQPGAAACRLRPPYGVPSRQRQSGTGFKYGFKKLWNTPPSSIV